MKTNALRLLDSLALREKISLALASHDRNDLRFWIIIINISRILIEN